MLTFLKKGVPERESVCVLQEQLLFVRFEFWLLSSDLDLASTKTSSKTTALEVIGFTLRVDTIRGEFRT